jgi:uracil-DNA glycosylase family 4
MCARLVAFRAANRVAHPDWHNGAVASFGDAEARLLIIGLAPGLQGANRTGRPFTGDYAGDLLYSTLARFGFARGVYRAAADDGLTLCDAMITNAVRCVPPANRPTPAEISTCRPFLGARMMTLANLKAVVCLGRIAHDSALTAFGVRKAAAPFAHGARHAVGRITLFDSYHCSRYNTNTGRLTPAMFESIFAAVRHHLDAA